jgi:nitrogen-specific signal transduction histidine kinase
MTVQSIDILDHLPLGIVMTDGNGNPLLVNRAAKSILTICGGRVPTLPELKPGEYRLDQNGRTIEITVSPIENNALFTLKDVTKSSRLEALEKHREQYAVMGELAAHIAHEIRNPLGSIELFASLLKRGLKKDKDIRRTDQIIASVKTVNTKISSLILSSQTWESPVDDVNIHDILKDIMLYSEQVIDQGMIYLSFRTADLEPFVEGNTNMIRQIFLSLILVALQSPPLSGCLDIETIHIPAPPTIEVHFRAAGRDFLERVTGTEAGAGMGLAITHHIMNMHRGSVRIEKHGQDHTSFILSFPLATGKNAGSLKENHEKV